MFKQKQGTPLEKSVQKVLDPKNDYFSRLKHLRIILDNYDSKEAKNFFFTHHRPIFQIFLNTFNNQDATLRQKGQKQSKSEYDNLLFILEKILVLLPELIERKWQYHSLTLVMIKLLNPGNTAKLRQEGVRLFLIWYQILGETGDSTIENMFASLVPGIIYNVPDIYSRPPNHIGGVIVHHGSPIPHHENSELLNDIPANLITCCSEPLIPAHPSEPKDLTCYFLQCFMDYIVSQVSKVCWKEPKESRQRCCFRFLFEKFKSRYLLAIFPSFNANFSIYASKLDMPTLRTVDLEFKNEHSLACKSVVIAWLAKYMRNENVDPVNRRDGQLDLSQNRNFSHQLQSAPQLTFNQNENKSEWREPSQFDYDLVRTVLYSSRANVNLIHEIFRQGFLMPFTQPITMKKVVSVYKDWIFCNTADIPPFMMEPEENPSADSIRVGLSAFLRVFIVNGASIFLIHVPPEKPTLLEEQVEMCKRVLNIFRYIVMKLEMNKSTWELLLLVMLHITSLLFPTKVPSRKEDFLGGRLAPAFFQTLIITWIKANLNVHISTSLWDQFQATLISLTQWEELIKEWSKTMETITRVMSRYVYNINLNDLPLERQNDKRKRLQKQPKADLASRIEDAKKSLRLDGSISINIDKKASTEIDSAQTAQSRPQYSFTGSSSYYPSHNLPLADAINSPSRAGLSRSASDSYLLTNLKKKLNRKRAFTISHTSLASRNFNQRPLSTRVRSDQLYTNLHESPFSSQSSVLLQSPSPTPCTGIETLSLKDSPWQIEGNSLGSNSSSSAVTQLPVSAGGSSKSWSPESSIILWRRMLGILGDINEIKNPKLHYQVMECLSKMIEDFVKVRDNIGVSVDNTFSPAPPTTVPPIHFFSSWLFKAINLPETFKGGKLLAYKMICQTVIRSQESPLGSEFLALFYLSIHQALHSKDLEVISTIIKNTGVKLFSFGLKGSSILLLDFIHACDSIVNSSQTKNYQIPRVEALSLLGSLISLTEACKKMKVLDPQSLEPVLIDNTNTKQLILRVLIGASKHHQTDLERCIVLNCLGILMYQEVKNRNSIIGDQFPEIINIFITETRFNNRYLPRIACDMLKLLNDHVTILLETHPSLITQVIQGLVGSISNHLTMITENNFYKDYKNVVLSLLFCLGEWAMSIPRKILLNQSKEAPCLLTLILSTLQRILKISHSDIKNDASNTAENSFSNDETKEFGEKKVEFDVSPNPIHRKTFPFDVSKSSQDSKDDCLAIKLATKMLLGHLLYYVGHFPLTPFGAARTSSLLTETDDNCQVSSNPDTNDLTSQVFNAPNILLTVINEETIVSFVDLSCEALNNSSSHVKTDPLVRVIVRDLIGKYSWDCFPVPITYAGNTSSVDNYSMQGDDYFTHCHHDQDVDGREEEDTPAPKNDPLDVLLKDIGKCIFSSKKFFPNTPVPALNDNLDQLEENMMALLSNQHYQEMSFIERPALRPALCKDIAPPSSLDSVRSKSNIMQDHMFFMHCRQLIDQFGYLFWEKRPKIDLLNRNDKILREIRNLDNQKCRETHKIAVLYVADKQEDKNSILLNKAGSEGFERFVAGLGWEIDLATHCGFRGGLQANRSTGVSAPYYANSFCEAIFHVSTRIPASIEESDSLRRKLTHLGNDEVHVVWSEHNRDYRRGIIPTEFCDVLIVIYPLQAFPGYHRIHVSRKPEVPFFGPLYSGAMIHHSILPDLVRATAINASRAGRLQVPFYQYHFQERARCIETIYSHHRSEKCFEDFAASIFSPQQAISGATSSLGHHKSVSIASADTQISGTTTTSALSSSYESSPKSKHRPLSMSNFESKQLQSRAVT